MEVLVRIPTPLRTVTKGAAEVHSAGDNVAGVIDDLERQYPGMRDRLLEANGSVRRFINLYVNEEDIRFLDGRQDVAEGGRPGVDRARDRRGRVSGRAARIIRE